MNAGAVRPGAYHARMAKPTRHAAHSAGDGFECSRSALEMLVRRPHRLEAHLNAPLLKERELFLWHLLQQGTSVSNVQIVARETLHVIEFLKLKELRLVDASEIKLAAKQWQAAIACRYAGVTNASAVKFERAAFRWLRFSNMICTTPPALGPYDEGFLRFGMFIKERYAAGTVVNYLQIVRDFLNATESRHPSLESIDVEDVSRFLDRHRQAGCVNGTIASKCQGLRSFFRYCEREGLIATRLSEKVRSPRTRRYDPEPRGPSWKDVKKLLNYPAKLSYPDLRARAVLYLCSVYALRGSEVTTLLLTDFDWKGEVFTLRRCKGGPVQRFPLQSEVGRAILQYLRFGRPKCSERRLFVTLYPPYRPILTNTVGMMVRRRMSELSIASKTTGSHALRHSCATQLLRIGASLREIADFLGHRDVESVSAYAKCSPKALRQVAAFSLEFLP
ncbi:tyrosine-type recombinase/integrase [Granulicella paludicola]|uniref:tyrosine-type recombinase/integrase n=1 Tax=Granulicella paludicola TaxID=474951 RepID=UPI0037BF90E8